MKWRVRTILTVLVLTCPADPAYAGKPEPLSAGAYILSVGKLKVGDRVPEFRAKDIYGVDVCLGDLITSGRKPVLAFWSMYCQACIEKFKAMVAMQTKFADRGLAVISVNTDGEYQKGEATIRDFIADYERKAGFKVNFPVLYDERNWLPAAMNIEFLPTLVTIDPQGRVAGFYQRFGEANETAILAGVEAMVRELLALYPAGLPVLPAAAPPGRK